MLHNKRIWNNIQHIVLQSLEELTECRISIKKNCFCTFFGERWRHRRLRGSNSCEFHSNFQVSVSFFKSASVEYDEAFEHIPCQTAWKSIFSHAIEYRMNRLQSNNALYLLIHVVRHFWPCMRWSWNGKHSELHKNFLAAVKSKAGTAGTWINWEKRATEIVWCQRINNFSHTQTHLPVYSSPARLSLTSMDVFHVRSSAAMRTFDQSNDCIRSVRQSRQENSMSC